MDKKRSYFWDNYKGILIFLVVLGHYLYAYAIKMNGRFVDDLFTFIYMFHMPAFVFCSGYLSKSEKARSKKAMLQLFLYYIAFNTFMMFFAHFGFGSKLKVLTPYYSYWYLLSLIVWRFVIGSLEKVKGIIPISVVIGLLLGYWSEVTNLLSIRRTIVFFIFFLTGYLFKKADFDRFIEKRNKKIMSLGALLGIGLSIATFLVVRTDRITLNMMLAGPYKNAEDIMIRILIFVVAFGMILSMMMVIPDRNIPFLTQIGKNSLLIYLAHRFITLVYAKVFPYTEYSRIHLIYMMIATVITCIILGNDKINNAVSKWFSMVTNEMVDENSRYGERIKTGLFLLFILILCIKPIMKIFRL